MRPFRFLHMADVHLDSPFASREEWLRHKLREATRAAFQAGIDLALSQGVDAVVVAGDLFDGQRISFATERFLLQQTARLREAGISFLYACGNHDPGGLMDKARVMDWPDNVVVFASPFPRTQIIHDSAGRPIALVTGAGHATGKEGDNLASRFDAIEPSPHVGRLPHVGLLHAWVTESGDDVHDRYAPCSTADLVRASQSAGIQYWALGHIHQQQEVCRVPRACYAGCLQGRNFREHGPKGALLVTLYPSGETEVQFHSLAPLQWETVTLGDLAAVVSPAQLERKAISACAHLADATPPGGVQRLVRLELAGPCPLVDELADEDNRLSLAESLQEQLGVLYVEVSARNLTRPVDVDAYREGTHVLATALDLVARARGDDALLDLLCPDVLAGFEKGDPATAEERRRAYLRQLLEGMEVAIAERLVSQLPATGGGEPL